MRGISKPRFFVQREDLTENLKQKVLTDEKIPVLKIFITVLNKFNQF